MATPVTLTDEFGKAYSLANPLPTASEDALGTDVAGTITAGAQSVTSNAADGFSTATVSLSGTYGGLSGVFEQSDDAAVTWYSVLAYRDATGQTESSVTNLTNVNGIWRSTIAGSDSFRFRSTALTSGTVNVLLSFTASPASAAVGIVANFVDVRPAAGTITTQDIASTSTGSLQDGAVLITGAPTANSTFSWAINGNSGMYTLVTGTWTGSLQFEKSLDGQTTWTPFGQHIDGTPASESIGSYLTGSIAVIAADDPAFALNLVSGTTRAANGTFTENIVLARQGYIGLGGKGGAIVDSMQIDNFTIMRVA